MASHNLFEWIQHPERLNRDTLYELRNLVARYPYFQSVRLLFLKNLYLLHDVSFGDELRKAVLYVADRRKLFYLIEGDKYQLHPQKQAADAQAAADKEPGMDRTLTLIDAFLASQPRQEQQAVMELDYAMDYTAYLMTETPEEVPSAHGADAGSAADAPPLRGQTLIDDFLRRDGETDVMKREREEDFAELAEEEADESEETGKKPADDLDDSCFTETLAKIYVKQQRYDKALEIIRKLSLNYPKKNAYFADQIRFLEKLIINAKSK